MEKPSHAIDGKHFDTLEGFFLAFQDAVLGGARWGSNLDSFNDVLRGGFGSPDGGFVLIWKNHATSQERLGFKETVRQLELRVANCHPDNRQSVRGDLENAKCGIGATVYDWLLEILRCHGSGGDEAVDGIDLVLA